MAKILVAKGKKPHQKAGGIGEILEVSIGSELDKVLARQLVEAVQLRAVEVSADRFEFRVELLTQYIAREGHSRVPRGHIEDGEDLGSWVHNMRVLRNILHPERIVQLNTLGFVWDPKNEVFEKHLSALETFVKREGHARVPRGHIESHIPLGNWVGNQRMHKDWLTAEEIARFEKLGFSWNVRDDDSEKYFSALERYVAREGNARVPRDHYEDQVALGQWVKALRTGKRIRLNPQRIAQLKKLSFVWDARDEKFERNFTALERYIAREGNALVPQRHIEDGIKLGSWVSSMRTYKHIQHREKVGRLNKVGFVWKTRNRRARVKA
jgi:hypothetical protein